MSVCFTKKREFFALREQNMLLGELQKVFDQLFVIE